MSSEDLHKMSSEDLHKMSSENLHKIFSEDALCIVYIRICIRYPVKISLRILCRVENVCTSLHLKNAQQTSELRT